MAMRTARYDKVAREIWQNSPRDMAKQPANYGETAGVIQWKSHRVLLHQMMQRAAWAVAACCTIHRSVLRRALQRNAFDRHAVWAG